MFTKEAEKVCLELFTMQVNGGFYAKLKPTSIIKGVYGFVLP